MTPEQKAKALLKIPLVETITRLCVSRNHVPVAMKNFDGVMVDLVFETNAQARGMIKSLVTRRKSLCFCYYDGSRLVRVFGSGFIPCVFCEGLAARAKRDEDHPPC